MSLNNLTPINIVLKQVREHNLKGFDLTLPLYQVICITGVSGSGKSSLAFDTLYAEGQRRYVETFSTYIRQYLERLPRPLAKSIEAIPPAIAIGQTNPIKNSRSTVGTLTEINHFMKMLFYRASTPWCPVCQRPIVAYDPLSAAKKLLTGHGAKHAVITAEVGAREDPGLLREGLVQAGYFRAYVENRVCDMDSLDEMPHTVEVVLDRLKLRKEEFPRLVDAFEHGFRMADEVRVHLPYGETLSFSSRKQCPVCGFKAPARIPNIFSFNSPAGACPECKGFGRITGIDWDLVIPDKGLSIARGAISVLEFPSSREVKEDLISYARSRGIPLDRPWAKLPEETRHRILFGDGAWYGVKGLFDWLESKRYKTHVRILLSRYRAFLRCPACGGTRFGPGVRAFRLNGLALPEFYSMDIPSALDWTSALVQGGRLDKAASMMAEEVKRRLGYLCGVGLHYLTLDRQGRTLSGGEVARAMLTRALSSDLAETLYVLDEPTTGLHARDTGRVNGFLKRLAQSGNTVVVVEHDPAVILSSDFVVDLGPGAGEHGGRLLFAGRGGDICGKNTPTAVAMKEVTRPKDLPQPKKDTCGYLKVEGAAENNLKDIDVRFPKGCISVITGVSGSGKSTLLEQVLLRGLFRQKGRPTEPPGACRRISGAGDLDQVVFLDQGPMGRSPRANPATYLKVFELIRPLLARVPRAVELGLAASAFSFNSSVGQCPECKGLGFEVVEMQFLSDLHLPCPACRGSRFRPEVLSVRFQGRNVAQILDLTLTEAVEFFSGHSGIARRIEPAIRVGLGYLRLGQPVNTLSGGEAQRLKIARELFRPAGNGTIFLLDEPTVGLHMKDVSRLLDALSALRDQGHTVIVAEHHLEVLRTADWVVDLGPGGGKEGGLVMYQGPVRGILKARKSVTGEWFARYLKGHVLKGAGETNAGRARVPDERPRGGNAIRVQGARHHNLRNVSLEIPRGRLTVVKGVSGSGKSTLAFDIIFAEGQRRYIESLPAYVRQFLKIYEQPDVDLVSGLPPTVAIEQRTSMAGPRSTVGTLTEIYHYLRLLYTRAGEPHCPKCGRRLSKAGPAEMLSMVTRKFHNEQVVLLAPKVRRRKGFHRPVLEAAARAGFSRARVDGKMTPLSPIPSLSRFREHSIEVEVARTKVDPQDVGGFEAALSLCMEEGQGECIVLGKQRELLLSRRLVCPGCGVSVPAPDPLLFSFNTSAGACPACRGLGETDRGKCAACHGTRLRPEALCFRVGGVDIGGLCAMPAAKALSFLEALDTTGREGPAGMLRDEAAARLSFLCEVGLSYLSLDRGGHTLSGGEAQRVRICSQLGSNLSGVCYVLDEPTIGLHPADTERLLKALKILGGRGNTVVMVEHDEECLRAADLVVDLGPGGGREGGKVVYAGNLQGLAAAENSVTAKALEDRERYKIASRQRRAERFLELDGACARNLKNICVRIPLSCLTVVTGVSGSGKSTLVMDVLHANLERLMRERGKGQKEASPRMEHLRSLQGHEGLSRVLVVDHSPIGRTPRSTPATYVGLMDQIRGLFAGLPESRARGWRAGRFSFNTGGGRCEACKGRGRLKVEMRFLPEVYVTCEVCEGRRYNPETLSVRYRGKNIAQVLEMTIAEAMDFFGAVPSLARGLGVLCDLGLGYLTLGQASPSLSGGEAQRIKLASEFVKAGWGSTLYILDEPSTGLHMMDVARLMRLIHALVDRGDTVLIIEHNLDVIKEADWIVDLGPGGGEAGGRVLFQGPIGRLITENTPTAGALRKFTGA